MSDESIVRELEKPQVGTIKLSEAIRIGAKMHPQGCAYDSFSGTCALGAAAYGSGYSRENGCLLDHLSAYFTIPRDIETQIHSRNALRNAYPEQGSYEAIATWLAAQGL